MSGRKEFAKLDLSHANQQMELEEKVRFYVTVNSIEDSIATDDFPLVIHQLLHCSSAPWILFCRVLLDDILVTGPDETTHFQHLQEV